MHACRRSHSLVDVCAAVFFVCPINCSEQCLFSFDPTSRVASISILFTWSNAKIHHIKVRRNEREKKKLNDISKKKLADSSSYLFFYMVFIARAVIFTNKMKYGTIFAVHLVSTTSVSSLIYYVNWKVCRYARFLIHFRWEISSTEYTILEPKLEKLINFWLIELELYSNWFPSIKLEHW